MFNQLRIIKISFLLLVSFSVIIQLFALCRNLQKSNSTNLFADFNTFNLSNGNRADNIYNHKFLTKIRCNKSDTKIMFTKNAKVAGTTISSILTQIATRYHKYEIFIPKKYNFYLGQNGTSLGYVLSHFHLKSLQKFKKLFPKPEFIWISTTRNVEDQINSVINFMKLERYYEPSKFEEVVRLFEAQDDKNRPRKHKTKLKPFWDGGTSFILYQCRQIENFEQFKTCAKDVVDNFDLIIPANKINEGLIMLHKITCLPLSDFAYVNKKVSTNRFKLSVQNMSTVLRFHKRSLWFYNYTSALFDRYFEQFRAEFCSNPNCESEIGQLQAENRKLTENCSLKRFDDVNFSTISYNWQLLRSNHSLALRCLSFAMSGNSFDYFKVYNKHIREPGYDDEKVADDWIKKLSNEEKPLF